MKRILTGALTLALAASMCVPALADSRTELKYLDDSTAITPKGVVVTAGEPATRVSADITWEDLTFVYKDGDKTWNPDTYTDDAAPGGWDTGKKAIIVTNHSNTALCASFSFKPEFTGIVGEFENSALLELESAVGTEPEGAPTGTMRFGIFGDKIDSTDETKIGTITIAVTNRNGEFFYKTVATDDELRTAIRDKITNIRVTNDIITNSSSSYGIDYNCTIDLNGFTVKAENINSALFTVSAPDYFRILNGSVEFSDLCRRASPIELTTDCALSVENCVLSASADQWVLWIRRSNTVRIKDSTFNYYAEQYPKRIPLVVEKGSLTLSGTVTINTIHATISDPILKMYDTASVVCEAGVYSFDPTAYVDTTRYDISSQTDLDGKESWTVTEKN